MQFFKQQRAPPQMARRQMLSFPPPALCVHHTVFCCFFFFLANGSYILLRFLSLRSAVQKSDYHGKLRHDSKEYCTQASKSKHKGTELVRLPWEIYVDSGWRVCFEALCFVQRDFISDMRKFAKLNACQVHARVNKHKQAFLKGQISAQRTLRLVRNPPTPADSQRFSSGFVCKNVPFGYFYSPFQRNE